MSERRKIVKPTEPTDAVYGYIVETRTYGNLTEGDRVKIIDTSANMHKDLAGITLEFVALKTNILSGFQWVELWGGTRGRISWHVTGITNIVKVDKVRNIV